MKYPIWFPYPKSWLRTIILLLSLAVIVFLIRVVGRITITSLSTSALFIDDPNFLDWAFLVWLIFTLIVLPIFIWSHINQFLWSDPNPKLPKWIPNWESLGEGIWSWGVSIVGIVIGFLMIEEFYPSDLSSQELSEAGKNVVAVSWLFTSAYLYHFRWLIAQKINQANQPKKRIS